MEMWLVVALAGVIVWMGLRLRTDWLTIESATGEERFALEAKHEYLKSIGIKSRLRSAEPYAGVQPPGMGSGVTKLEVPEPYVLQAQEVLREFELDR